MLDGLTIHDYIETNLL